MWGAAKLKPNRMSEEEARQSPWGRKGAWAALSWSADAPWCVSWWKLARSCHMFPYFGNLWQLVEMWRWGSKSIPAPWRMGVCIEPFRATILKSFVLRVKDFLFSYLNLGSTGSVKSPGLNRKEYYHPFGATRKYMREVETYYIDIIDKIL